MLSLASAAIVLYGVARVLIYWDTRGVMAQVNNFISIVLILLGWTLLALSL